MNPAQRSSVATGTICLRRAMHRAVVATLGSSVVVIGMAFISLPVPGVALLVILLGLAILSSESPWVRKRLQQPFQRLVQSLRSARPHGPARRGRPSRNDMSQVEP